MRILGRPMALRITKLFGVMLVYALTVYDHGLFDSRPRGANITLCVPCIPADIQSGDIFAMLDSVKKQELLPKEIILALSSATPEYVKSVTAALSEAAFPVPLLLTAVMFPRTPGQNRNRASELASGDIISFFDADDLMHVSRIKVLHQAFASQPNLQLALHGLNNIDDLSKSRAISYHNVKKVFSETLCFMEEKTRRIGQLWISSGILSYEITHGHSTVRREMLDYHRFFPIIVGEDCKFVRSILQEICSVEENSYKGILLDFPFTRYVPRAIRMKAQKKIQNL